MLYQTQLNSLKQDNTQTWTTNKMATDAWNKKLISLPKTLTYLSTNMQTLPLLRGCTWHISQPYGTCGLSLQCQLSSKTWLWVWAYVGGHLSREQRVLFCRGCKCRFIQHQIHDCVCIIKNKQPGVKINTYGNCKLKWEQIFCLRVRKK